MNDEPDYLDLDDLLAAAEAFLGGPPDVTDFGLLESALARPRATVYGEDAYADIHAKAAALLHSLVKNHGLVDGNKRLGVVATLLFYGLNGYTCSIAEDEGFALVLGVADGSIDTIAAIAERLALLVRPV